MNKDVIYIDVDDDVTAIIGKIKNAKEKIVAVVPPKRAGTLQSAVNLRLLDRMARADKKQLVLITNNPALVALAANAAIPVAKNLQSKPEVAEVAAIAVDDGDDIIDGADLPVGDHANSVKVKDGTRAASVPVRGDVIDSIDVDNDGPTSAPETLASASAATYGAAKSAKSPRGKVKIPNFDKFRKRLFFGIGGGILLIALLIWMFVFAPAATIVVTAATTPTPISSTVKLGGTAATDYKAGIVKSVSQQEKKDETISFDATGTKDVGTQATGTVKFSTNSFSGLGTIPAGTVLTSSSSVKFTTDSAVTLTPSNHDGATTTITAVSNGTSANGATGNMNGAPAEVSAVLQGTTAGGTSKIAQVVSQDDVDRATGQLIGKSTDAEKKSLAAKFKNGEKVIDSSFTVDRTPAVSSPAVNAEAPTGKATLTVSTTYTIYAIASADLESYLNSSLVAQINDTNTQKVYDTGIKNVGLSNFTNEGGTMTVAVTATGQIGPKIDEDQIKNQVKGKIYGEVQSTLQQINGIQNVDVKFSYFWVRTVPNNTNKIHIQFQVQNE